MIVRDASIILVANKADLFDDPRHRNKTVVRTIVCPLSLGVIFDYLFMGSSQAKMPALTWDL